jgi:hypothetical protein
MQRRHFLSSIAAAVALAPLPAFAGAEPQTRPLPHDRAGQRLPATGDAPSSTRIAAAWRGLASDSQQHVGVLAIDWERQAVGFAAKCAVPGRAHGLLAEAGGGFIAVAYRFGTWLWRIDRDGRVVQRIALRDEPGSRRFSGHVVQSADGTALLTTEFDPDSGEGFVSVRDARTLKKLDEWRTHGNDPHQLVVDPDGDVIVANGGVLRTLEDRKRDLDRMASSLVRLDGRTGALHGQWTLDDARLSLRHLAYSAIEGHGRPLLGIALQAEHDDPARRAEAPVLAIFGGERLAIPCHAADGRGYAGDIASAPGGFVVSCQNAARALWWRADAPATLTTVASLREVCALAAVSGGTRAVALAAGAGIGRWDPRAPAVMLAWPEPVAVDNHCVELA